ncbi:unnamed protein product [Pseudo-nitzschia multistriata]|uniref:Uncharacterized protein n=1 Tax=Pseudo-nitzschia multistriata TaxID=183589 RepID=A0A448ZA57_9STRA|nr:unnamed protein product [Pseudo-nitzschia multistriata]
MPILTKRTRRGVFAVTNAMVLLVAVVAQAIVAVGGSSVMKRTHSHSSADLHVTTIKSSSSARSTGDRRSRSNSNQNGKGNRSPRASVVNQGQMVSRVDKKEAEPLSEGVYTDKPVLRGKFHKWGAIVYPPLLGVPLHLRALAAAATTPPSAATSTEAFRPDLIRASILFSFAVESIMVVSATLHRYPWKTQRWHQIARKADFTAIFVGIASLYSSMGHLLMGHHPTYSGVIEPLVWACALVGSLTKWFVPDAPQWVNASVFLVQGWAVFPCIPMLVSSSSTCEAIGLVGGGIFVTLGAIAYSLQWPRNTANKAQREIVFGPHEVFHVGTLFMVASFWFTMWNKISSSVTGSV